MSNYEKSQVVLANYKKFFPKSLDPSLTPHVSAAPNHPSVDPYHVDDKILHEMNAKDYCISIRYVIRKMRTVEDGVYSAILHNKFIVMNTVTNLSQARKMGVSKMTFYRKLHHAEKIFSTAMNSELLDYLYGMAIK